MPNDDGLDSGRIEFLDPPDLIDVVGVVGVEPTHRSPRLSALSLGGLRAPWIAATLAVAGCVAVIVAQFLNQFSITFDVDEGELDPRFSVDGFGRIHAHQEGGGVSFSGHEARLGVPALIAAAVLLLGVGYFALRRRPVARQARTVAWVLTGLIAGCLVSVSLVAADDGDESWSFQSGWWLYAAGTVCLALACLAVPSEAPEDASVLPRHSRSSDPGAAEWTDLADD